MLATQPPAVQLAYRPKLCTPPPAAQQEQQQQGAAPASAPSRDAEPSSEIEPVAEEGETSAAAAPVASPTSAPASAPAAGPAQGPGRGAVLTGAPPVAVIATVRPYLERSWAAALDACTCMLAQQQQQDTAAAAAGGGGGSGAGSNTAAAGERHQALLDLCQMALCSATEPQSGDNSAAGRWATEAGGLVAALRALQRLTGPAFVATGTLGVEGVAELTALLLGLLRQVLLPAAGASPARRANGRNGQAAQDQLGSAALAPAAVAASAAEVLKQLAAAAAACPAPHPLAAATQQQLLAAAEACTQLAVPGFAPLGASNSSSGGGSMEQEVGEAAGSDAREALYACVLPPALDCAKTVVRAAAAPAAGGSEGGGEVLVVLLQRALLLGTSVLGAAQQAEQLSAGAAYLLDLAGIIGPALQAAGPGDREPAADGSEGLPSSLVVVAAAAASLAEQAQQQLAAGCAQQLGSSLSAMLPVAAALACASPAPAPAAAAGPAAIEDADWGDEDAFESAEATQAEAEAEADAPSEAEQPAAVAAGDAAAGVAALSLHDPAAPAAAQAAEGEAPAQQGPAAATLQLCLGVVQQAAAASDPAIIAALLQALRGYLQQLAGAAPAAAVQWGLRCAAVALPPAAERVHALMQTPGPVGEQDVQVGAAGASTC